MENILEVKNLCKNFEDFALDNISFNIPKGSIVGLIGENGSGKTTTIKSILNIVKRTSGDVSYFGKNLDGFELEIKEELGVVLDGHFFHDSLSPKNIESILAKTYKTWKKEVFLSYLNKFQIPLNKPYKEFSKGMKTKLSIACALSHKSSLLILDEPTSGLDPMVRLDILDELLNFIQDNNSSILFSTHITSDLDKIADYIVLLHKGRLVLNNDREEVLSNYGIVRTNREGLSSIPKEFVVAYLENSFSLDVLVSNRSRLREGFIVDNPSIEDIMIFFTRGTSI